MKKQTSKKLKLSRQSVAQLSNTQLRDAGGGAPDPFPPSWFRCTFTLYQCD